MDLTHCFGGTRLERLVGVSIQVMGPEPMRKPVQALSHGGWCRGAVQGAPDTSQRGGVRVEHRDRAVTSRVGGPHELVDNGMRTSAIDVHDDRC